LSANVTTKGIKHQKATAGSWVEVAKLPMPGRLSLLVVLHSFSSNSINYWEIITSRISHRVNQKMLALTLWSH